MMISSLWQKCRLANGQRCCCECMHEVVIVVVVGRQAQQHNKKQQQQDAVTVADIANDATLTVK